MLAREAYLRRAEGDRLWVVRRDHVVAADDGFVEPNADKPHRHHDGAAVAARRRAARQARGEPKRGIGSDLPGMRAFCCQFAVRSRL